MGALVIPAVAVAVLAGCVETSDMEATAIAPTPADRAAPAYRSCVGVIARQTGNPRHPPPVRPAGKIRPGKADPPRIAGSSPRRAALRIK